MYQQQQFHTANYRGNQQGHDAYLRSDSQQPSSMGFGSFGGGQTISQYQGLQNSFQPTGYVQSFYDPQKVSTSGYGSSNYSSQQPSTGAYGNVSAQSYHTANYRGDQQGHDAYLRSDSQNPAQSGYGSSFTSTFTPAASFSMMSNQGNFGTTSSYGTSSMGNTSSMGGASTQSYHTANYRGDQQGHDNYLRADSTQPSQFGGMTGGFGASSMGSTGYGSMPTYSSTSAFGASNQSGGQFTSPQSYHTANYRGDQQGHDNYLRSDSQNPAQMGGSSSFSNYRNF